MLQVNPRLLLCLMTAAIALRPNTASPQANEGTTLFGRVLDGETREPVSGALVRVRLSGSALAHTATDSAGWFRFGEPLHTGVPHETVEAYATGFVPDVQRVQLACRFTIATADSPARCLKRVDLYLQREPDAETSGMRACRIAGQVLDPEGHPMPAVQVQLLSGAPAALTANDGTFALADMPNGLQILRASMIGYFAHDKVVAVQCSQGATSVVATFQLFPAVVE